MNAFLSFLFVVMLSASAALADVTNLAPLLTLPEAQELALTNHPQVAAANYRALAAGEVVKESKSGYYPAATLFGNAVGADSADSRILAGGLNNPSIMNREAQGVYATQLITDFGRTANLTASSRYRARAENQTAAATREQVLLDTDTAYFDALEAQAVESVAQQTFETRSLLLSQVSLLASNKLKSSLDVSFSQVALEEGRLLLQRAQNDYAAAQASLSAALGLRESRTFQLVEPAATPPTDTNDDVAPLIAEALANRPDLIALRDQRDAALRYAKSRRDERLPTVSAVGAAGNSFAHDDRLPDKYAVGGLQISVPLFAGGLYLARQREAELQAEAAAEQVRAAEDNVIRDARIAWLNLNDARQRQRTTAQLVSHASDAYDLANARYQAGSSSIVELSQAQLELTSAQIANTNARYDVLIQEANLNYQIGAISRAAARSPALNREAKD